MTKKEKKFLRKRNQIFAAKVKMKGLPVTRNEMEIISKFLTSG